MERKLPILATLVAATDLCREHFIYSLKITAPWFFILLIAPYILLAINIVPSTGVESAEGLLFELLSLALYTVAWGSIAVLWHWRVLRDDSHGGKTMILDRRVWRYVLRGIMIGIIVVAAAFPFGFVLFFIENSLAETAFSPYAAGATTACLWILTGLVFARLAIALPAIALDVPNFGLANAWDATRGNGFRAMFVFSLPFLAASLPYWGLGLASTNDHNLFQITPAWIVVRVLLQISEFVFGLIGLAILSLTYAFFVERRDKTALQES